MMNELQFLKKISERKFWRLSDLPSASLTVWLRLCQKRAIVFSALAKKSDGSIYRLPYPCDNFNPFINPAIAGAVETVISSRELFDVSITDEGRLMLVEKPIKHKRGPKVAYDPVKDEKLVDDWRSSDPPMTKAQYENMRRIPAGSIQRAIDRLRKQ